MVAVRLTVGPTGLLLEIGVEVPCFGYAVEVPLRVEATGAVLTWMVLPVGVTRGGSCRPHLESKGTDRGIRPPSGGSGAKDG